MFSLLNPQSIIIGMPEAINYLAERNKSCKKRERVVKSDYPFNLRVERM